MSPSITAIDEVGKALGDSTKISSFFLPVLPLNTAKSAGATSRKLIEAEFNRYRYGSLLSMLEKATLSLFRICHIQTCADRAVKLVFALIGWIRGNIDIG